MDELERLAIAALLHDLEALTQQVAPRAGTNIAWAIKRARLDDAPALAAILEQAESYAMPAGADRAMVGHAPLVSIFARVQIEDATERPESYYPAVPLPATDDFQRQVFPISAPDSSGRAAHIQTLFQALDRLGARVDLTRFDRVYQHLLALLQRYGWCLPAHSPDVALFDHAKLTSAIAACLYRYHTADLAIAAIERGAPEERFCLLVGDLSGIQDYIFGITTIGPGGVARRLRARSFYLAALADVLSHQIVRRFGLPLGNVIMASGGKFYVLLDNHAGLESEIAALRKELDGWLRETFNGEIALNLAHMACIGARLRASSQDQPGFGAVVTELSRRLNREKRRRGQSVLTSAGAWDESAFVVRRDFWGLGACVSCGKFPASRPENLCDKCERDELLGRRLTRARYAAYYDAPQEDAAAIPMPGGWSARVLGPDELPEAGAPYLLVKLNDPAIDELAEHPGAFRYLANHVPIGDYHVGLSFEEIAAQSQGRPLLGYAKADVDHLGILFAQGLRRAGASFDTAAHIAALSRALDTFFSGWIQSLLSRTADYQHFYTIFSGGDDLFLVGPWDKAAGLARAVRENLAAFAGDNPDISLSAGILFTKERYPIWRAAHDAEEQLEHSKERVWADTEGQPRTRDQLTILGDTFRWEEAPALFEQIATLQSRSAYLTSAMLYDLIEYGRLYRLWSEKNSIEGLRYKALFAYNIARNLRRGDAELYRWADGLMQSLQSATPNLTMRHLELIATYLLFGRRG